jgi:hypothetical protein
VETLTATTSKPLPPFFHALHGNRPEQNDLNSRMT